MALFITTRSLETFTIIKISS